MLSQKTAEEPQVHAIHATSWLKEFPEVMKKDLGLLKGIKADVEIAEGTTPKFCKSRPVPFALVDQVKATIKKQVEDGELEPVDQSEWASPIVVVRKNDGNLRICTDFKATINPHLKTNLYRHKKYIPKLRSAISDTTGIFRGNTLHKVPHPP